jgi:hypothetical protein
VLYHKRHYKNTPTQKIKKQKSKRTKEQKNKRTKRTNWKGNARPPKKGKWSCFTVRKCARTPIGRKKVWMGVLSLLLEGVDGAKKNGEYYTLEWTTKPAEESSGHKSEFGRKYR